jgi:hypothetical protein
MQKRRGGDQLAAREDGYQQRRADYSHCVPHWLAVASENGTNEQRRQVSTGRRDQVVL